MTEPWQIALVSIVGGAILQTLLREATPWIKNVSKKAARDKEFVSLVILTLAVLAMSTALGWWFVIKVSEGVSDFDARIAAGEPAGRFVFKIAMSTAFLLATILAFWHFMFETLRLWRSWLKSRREA